MCSSAPVSSSTLSACGHPGRTRRAVRPGSRPPRGPSRVTGKRAFQCWAFASPTQQRAPAFAPQIAAQPLCLLPQRVNGAINGTRYCICCAKRVAFKQSRCSSVCISAATFAAASPAGASLPASPLVFRPNSAVCWKVWSSAVSKSSCNASAPRSTYCRCISSSPNTRRAGYAHSATERRVVVPTLHPRWRTPAPAGAAGSGPPPAAPPGMH